MSEGRKRRKLYFGTLNFDRPFVLGVKTEFAIDSVFRCSVMQSYRLEL